MKFNTEDYRAAAHERFNAAVQASSSGEYVIAHYLAGVAVECMLRAYRYRIDKEFDARHHLYDLAKASRFLDLIPEGGGELRGVFSELNLRWHNDHRYCSDKKLRAYLVGLGMAKLDRYKVSASPGSTVRGDLLKMNAVKMIELAKLILGLGETKWS